MTTEKQNIMKIPQVLRARGYRLYTKDGKRFIDLWLNGGSALLGHTPPYILRELKNTASRGLYAPYPHFTEGRLLKALAKLLPEYVFRIYSHRGHKETQKHEEDLKRWFPFTGADSPLLELVLPVPLSLCVIAAKSEEQLSQLPPNETLPPLVLATAARAIHDLLAAPERAKPNLPRTFKALKESSCPWQRESIYLTLKEDTIAIKAWGKLFDMFFEEGFLIPPSPKDPLILPGEMSDGEDAKLAKILTSVNAI